MGNAAPGQPDEPRETSRGTVGADEPEASPGGGALAGDSADAQIGDDVWLGAGADEESARLAAEDARLDEDLKRAARERGLRRTVRLSRDQRESVVKTDLFGRRALAKLSAAQYLAVFVRGGLTLSLVPSHNWERGADADADFASVLCACGGRAEARAAAMPQKCACERWFYYDGTALYSLRKTDEDGPPLAPGVN